MNDSMTQRVAKCLGTANLAPELDLAVAMDERVEKLKAEKIKKAKKPKGGA